MLRRFIDAFHRTTDYTFNNPVRRFQLSILALFLLIGFATLVYMILEEMSPTEALYMTIITITTVGFGEVRPLSEMGRAFTIILIVLGVGVATTAISNAVGIILGPRLWMSIRQRNLERLIMNIENHYIVCGYGRMGRQVIDDLEAREERFVLIDSNPELEEDLVEANVPYIIGDATQDEILTEAGIGRARGLVAALNSDADNVMTVMTARELNPRLLIVARVTSADAERKLRRAGANRVVSPYQIGGHRIALSLLRPAVNDFLDQIFHFRADLDMEIGELYVYEGSDLAGQTIAACDLRNLHNVNILAIQNPSGKMIITPTPSYKLEPGQILIVMGPPDNVYSLERRYQRQE